MVGLTTGLGGGREGSGGWWVGVGDGDGGVGIPPVRVGPCPPYRRDVSSCFLSRDALHILLRHLNHTTPSPSSCFSLQVLLLLLVVRVRRRRGHPARIRHSRVVRLHPTQLKEEEARRRACSSSRRLTV